MTLLVFSIQGLRLALVANMFYFLFRPANPPPLGAGGDLDILATPTVAQYYVTSFKNIFFGGMISPR